MRRSAIAILGALVVAGMAPEARADRMVLWHIVHDQCVVDQKTHGAPAPCALVDIADGEDRGVAILKDIHGIAQYLAIPTRLVQGMESPELLDPALPNYWRAAWRARNYLDARLPHALPRDGVGLVVNAASRRSQDQLHIHIDCVAPDVRAALAAYREHLGADWHVLPFKLGGRRYWARRLDSVDLAGVSPFLLLADGVNGAKGAMGEETLVAIGETFAPVERGFILLADRADPDGGGHGEDLLDAQCALSRLMP
jgi:CDP-diacylglycerol pyrophosphatase